MISARKQWHHVCYNDGKIHGTQTIWRSDIQQRVEEVRIQRYEVTLHVRILHSSPGGVSGLSISTGFPWKAL